MSTSTLSIADRAMAGFDATTSRWGRLTMIGGLILSITGPVYLLSVADVGVTTTQVLAAFLAVAGAFGVFWVLEPLTYYPILGPAAMYQAFMIGNISNKLLPAAVVAQNSIDAKPGTRRGDLASVMAICGAAMVHLTSLLIFVGFFGTYLISIIPADVIAVARLYIVPAVMGAVLVQAIVTMRQPRTTVVALVVAAAVIFGLVRLFPATTFYATAVAVFTTVAIAWLVRDKSMGYTEADAVEAVEESEL
ncbi:MAG: hypothetical protein ACK5MT_03015 [Actinomycetales bacterium]